MSISQIPFALSLSKGFSSFLLRKREGEGFDGLSPNGFFRSFCGAA
jgi:hypothetical protein